MFSELKKFVQSSSCTTPATVAPPTSHPEAGRELQIGEYHVTIVDLIAEGGFALVFLVKDAHDKFYALKRMRARDEEAIKNAEKEIEVMKALTGHENVVALYASMSQISGKFREFYLLMEHCQGHVVDVMNRRLKARKPFSQSEVLKIFSDICLGLATMHLHKPPYIHRDLKLENVLLGSSLGTFKLCDFGSVTTHIFSPGSSDHVQDVEDDITKYTTPQYRAPEMVDLYCGKQISTKADIWAMGCLLYKLCFFEDAFTDSKLSVLSGKYKIPPSHEFSAEVLDLIAILLNPDPDKRPDIVALSKRVFALRQIPCPLDAMSSNSPRNKRKLPVVPTRPQRSSLTQPLAAPPQVAQPKQPHPSENLFSAPSQPFFADFSQFEDKPSIATREFPDRHQAAPHHGVDSSSLGFNNNNNNNNNPFPSPLPQRNRPRPHSMLAGQSLDLLSLNSEPSLRHQAPFSLSQNSINDQSSSHVLSDTVSAPTNPFAPPSPSPFRSEKLNNPFAPPQTPSKKENPFA